ncbi:alcohol dehydrogenase catalytic domain-containing protein [Nocardioides sp. B-3]|nr:alcohol dehydrogenase catalytic domain-containing protein [Nocardioides sp. B-3]UUZ58251.1 alcohol dehydrogenase catalytic domain-containing protein [Nocardioides sp. B-3]
MWTGIGPSEVPATTRPAPLRLELAVTERTVVATDRDVVSFRPASPDGARLPTWRPGAHLDVHLPSGRKRQYSLCGDPAERTSYRIAVRRIPDGLGGSVEMHDLPVGASLRVSRPRNAFPLALPGHGSPAERLHFVAGGIGITPILPMLRLADAPGVEWTMVYVGRRRDTLPFPDELAPYGDRVSVRTDEVDGHPTAEHLLAGVDDATAVYCCGPVPMIDLLRRGLRGRTDVELHSERFSAPPGHRRPGVHAGAGEHRRGVRDPGRPVGPRRARRDLSGNPLLVSQRLLRHLQAHRRRRRGRPPRRLPDRRRARRRLPAPLRLAGCRRPARRPRRPPPPQHRDPRGETMKAVVCRDTELRVTDLPTPVPGRGHLLLDVHHCGICGSDLHARHHADEMAAAAAASGYDGFMRAHDSVVFGHEFCGEVIDHGPGTSKELMVGTRVVAMPILRTAGAVHTTGLSPHAPGGFAERVVVRAALAMPVPNGLASDKAALTEPMAVALHAVRRGRGRQGPGCRRDRLRPHRSGRDLHAQGLGRADRDRQRPLPRSPGARRPVRRRRRGRPDQRFAVRRRRCPREVHHRGRTVRPRRSTR